MNHAEELRDIAGNTMSWKIRKRLRKIAAELDAPVSGKPTCPRGHARGITLEDFKGYWCRVCGSLHFVVMDEWKQPKGDYTDVAIRKTGREVAAEHDSDCMVADGADVEFCSCASTAEHRTRQLPGGSCMSCQSILDDDGWCPDPKCERSQGGGGPPVEVDEDRPRILTGRWGYTCDDPRFDAGHEMGWSQGYERGKHTLGAERDAADKRYRKLAAGCEALKRDVANATERARRLIDERGGSVHLWAGDEDDDLATLACPVLILPEQLRGIFAERDRLARLIDVLDDSVLDLDTRLGASESREESLAGHLRSAHAVSDRTAAVLSEARAERDVAQITVENLSDSIRKGDADWAAVARAAGEEPGIMVTSLSGRVGNMRTDTERLIAERDAANALLMRADDPGMWIEIAAHLRAAGLRKGTAR